VVVLALALCAPVLARQQSAHLRMSRSSPVTAQGSGFKAQEFVKVTLRLGKVTKVHGAKAKPNGKFRVVWRGLSIQNCDWSIVAGGGGGSRATVKGNAATCQTLPPFD